MVQRQQVRRIPSILLCKLANLQGSSATSFEQKLKGGVILSSSSLIAVAVYLPCPALEFGEFEKDSLGKGNEGVEGPATLNLDNDLSRRGDEVVGVEGAVEGR